MDRPIQNQMPFGLAEAGPDPFVLFDCWFKGALSADPHNAAVVALATATPIGRPALRMVLLKHFDVSGFVFYTHYEGRKAGELAVNPFAAMTFWWPPSERQVRLEGAIEKISDAESDAYFATRPRESQLSAWASPQSSVIESPVSLEALRGRFRDGVIPRPVSWGGFRLSPDSFEFWQGRTHRLHDRIRFTRNQAGWQRDRLAP